MISFAVEKKTEKKTDSQIVILVLLPFVAIGLYLIFEKIFLRHPPVEKSPINLPALKMAVEKLEKIENSAQNTNERKNALREIKSNLGIKTPPVTKKTEESPEKPIASIIPAVIVAQRAADKAAEDKKVAEKAAEDKKTAELLSKKKWTDSVKAFFKRRVVSFKKTWGKIKLSCSSKKPPKVPKAQPTKSS